jgi:hypothetical protein
MQPFSDKLPTMTGARRRLLPRGPKGYFLRVNSGLRRGVDEGSSAIAMHHISAAMIAGYQNNIGMTYLPSYKTLTGQSEFPAITAGDRKAW